MLIDELILSEAVNTVDAQRRANKDIWKLFGECGDSLYDIWLRITGDTDHGYEAALKDAGERVKEVAQGIEEILGKVAKEAIPNVRVRMSNGIISTNPDARGIYRPEDRIIVVRYDNKEIEDALKGAVRLRVAGEDFENTLEPYITSLVSVFVHELEHAMQFRTRAPAQYGSVGIKQKSMGQRAKYISQAIEIDAFAANYVYEIVNNTTRVGEVKDAIYNYTNGYIEHHEYNLEHLKTIMDETSAKIVKRRFDKRVVQKLMHYADYLSPSYEKEFANNNFADTVSLMVEKIARSVYPQYHSGGTFYSDNLYNYSATLVKNFFVKPEVDYEKYDKMVDRVSERLTKLIEKRLEQMYQEEYQQAA